MVRVNLVDPAVLSDQHLIAEHNEIRMIITSFRRSLRTQSLETVMKKVKPEFTLGQGHALFFFDKLVYLQKRHKELEAEGLRRGFTFNYHLDLVGFYSEQFNDYTPDSKALKIICDRINTKLNMKLDWYRYYGERGKAKLLKA